MGDNVEVSVVPTQADREAAREMYLIEHKASDGGNAFLWGWRDDHPYTLLAVRLRLAHQTPPATQPSATVEQVAQRLCDADYARRLARFRASNSSASMSINMEYAMTWEQANKQGGYWRQQWIDRAEDAIAATLHAPPPVATATVVDDATVEHIAFALSAGWPNSLANVHRSDLLSMVRTVAKRLAATPTPQAGDR